jgi:AGZA family xanthine/uracil permease-like MFS transporter
MPFTYSITNGIGAGFLSFVAIKLALGKVREIHPLVWGVSVCFLAYFAIDPLQQLLGVK